MEREDRPAPRERSSRLTPIDRSKELLPLRRAYTLASCNLYWLPVKAFPVPNGQRAWLMHFLDGLYEIFTSKLGLRPEVFLQYKTIYPDLIEDVIKTSTEFSPLFGLSRRPGEKLNPPPSEEEFRPIFEGKAKFDFRDHMANYCYWFMGKVEKKQREIFFGRGGMTSIWLPPDPKTAPPDLPMGPAIRNDPAFKALFEQIDVDAVIAQTHALLDSWPAKSKELFGEGLEDDAQFEGIFYILPLLSTANFFGEPEDVVDRWFELFDVYVNESPADLGILLATRHDLEEDLIHLLRQMETDGLTYPKG